jgi:hypothetical protein
LSRRAVALVTLAPSALVASTPLVLARQGEPLWRLTLPLAAWSLLGMDVLAPPDRDPDGALRLLRVGAAGQMLLLALAAPPLLEKRESGRALFSRPRAGGAGLGAWARRDGRLLTTTRVREAEGPMRSRARRPQDRRWWCGPAERRILARSRSSARVGDRAAGNALAEVR